MGGKILVVKREVLFKEGNFQGFLNVDSKNYIEAILENFEFIERDHAEGNPTFQQPIPYVWLVNKSEKKVFAYKRAMDKNYRDQRLRNKWSCGVGGHIDKDTEENTGDPIASAMMRELQEEVIMENYPIPKVVGYINDDSNSVGKDHFGIVAIAETEDNVKKGDEEMAHGTFYSVNELEMVFKRPENDIESWTRLSWPFVKNYIEN